MFDFNLSPRSKSHARCNHFFLTLVVERSVFNSTERTYGCHCVIAHLSSSASVVESIKNKRSKLASGQGESVMTGVQLDASIGSAVSYFLRQIQGSNS